MVLPTSALPSFIGSSPPKAPKQIHKELLTACTEGNVKVVKELIACHQALVNEQNEKGATPLFLACQYGHLEIVQLLIDNKAEIELAKHNGSTPLLAACYNGHLSTAELLIHHGAAVNHMNNEGWSPLIYACNNRHWHLVELLLKRGANVNATNKNAQTPFYWACRHGCPLKIVQLLAENGADLDQSDAKGLFLLYTACQFNHFQVAEFLIHLGANVNQAEHSDNTTPLFVASYYNHLEIAEMLIAHGANPNLAKKNGISPLMAACEQGHLPMAKLLIRAGANVDQETLLSKFPLHFAYTNGRAQIIELLLAYSHRVIFDLFLIGKLEEIKRPGYRLSPNDSALLPILLAAEYRPREIGIFEQSRSLIQAAQNHQLQKLVGAIKGIVHKECKDFYFSLETVVLFGKQKTPLIDSYSQLPNELRCRVAAQLAKKRILANLLEPTPTSYLQAMQNWLFPPPRRLPPSWLLLAINGDPDLFLLLPQFSDEVKTKAMQSLQDSFDQWRGPTDEERQSFATNQTTTILANRILSLMERAEQSEQVLERKVKKTDRKCKICRIFPRKFQPS